MAPLPPHHRLAFFSQVFTIRLLVYLVGALDTSPLTQQLCDDANDHVKKLMQEINRK